MKTLSGVIQFPCHCGIAALARCDEHKSSRSKVVMLHLFGYCSDLDYLLCLEDFRATDRWDSVFHVLRYPDR